MSTNTEYIKVAKVDDVTIHKRGQTTKGTLHLTTHHLIFTSPDTKREFWLPYHLIHSVFKNKGSSLLSLHQDQPKLWHYSNIKIITKDLLCFSMDFENYKESQDVYDSIYNLTVLKKLDGLYCFLYKPNVLEKEISEKYNLKPFSPLFDTEKEFYQRQKAPEALWRTSDINLDFKFCSTYPKKFIVPKNISDTLLKHASKYRSSCRIPVLTYYHKQTDTCIVRSSQPLPGITQQRSPQDERLIEGYFFNNTGNGVVNSDTKTMLKKNIIVDCRPTANAYAQVALGGGTENMDNYNFDNTTSRMFLGIPNIHAIRDSLQSLVDNVVVDNDLHLSIPSKYKVTEELGSNIAWFKHIRNLLQSTETLVKHVVFNKSNVLIHCSDGWDRTAQIAALVQLCVDPYYRTLEGFMVLIEKEWYNFGHRFMERCNHLNNAGKNFHDNVINNYSNSTDKVNSSINDISNDNNNTNTDSSSNKFQQASDELSQFGNGLTNMLNNVSISLKERKKSVVDDKASSTLNNLLGNKTSPIFFQFLECCFQLLHQNPTSFEFNERFLRRLVYHLYSCQYGNFIFNNERERFENKELFEKTTSIWCYFLSRKQEFTNPNYVDGTATTKTNSEYWILPDYNNINWWYQLLGRKKEDFIEEQITTETLKTNDSNNNLLKKHTKILSYAFNLDMFKS